jgi:hypothetical protein
MVGGQVAKSPSCRTDLAVEKEREEKIKQHPEKASAEKA